MPLSTVLFFSAAIHCAAITADDFLSVNSKGALVTRTGKQVVLKGVNLGGWMIQESWMCPVNGEDKKWANLNTIESLESRGFTREQILNLFNTYQDSWITPYDLDIISSWGCNCVRVPFWYRNFMWDINGTWINNDLNQNPGFKRLDWIIQQAGNRGLYVILDLHGAPCGQSKDHCCGTLDLNELYTNTVCQETTKKLWAAIANRYRSNPVVAAYDLLNEPNNNGGTQPPNNYDPWVSSTWALTNAMYEKLLTTVRAADPQHIVSLEGIWRLTNLPDPKQKNWTNMLYQVHMYDSTASFKSLCKDMAATQSKWGCGLIIGEFSNLDGIAIAAQYNYSWTTWSYKGGKGENGNWFAIAGKPTPIDSTKDSYETMITKWGAPLHTTSNFKQTAAAEMIKKGCL